MFLVVTITHLLVATSAHAEKRIALLIGNKDYKQGVGALVNPLNDVRVVGEALKTIGFEVMLPIENASRSTMLLAIHAFATKLKNAGADAVGFLYYSGHGIASAGENYLVPVDIEEPSTVLLSVQGVKQSEVLATLRNEAPSAAHYLVLDACRNNLQGARGGKGFVPVGQQSGVLVAFAAEPGKTASDTGQISGPYAAALAAELVKPGQSDLIMFHHVRVAVMEKTRGDQVPWTEDGIQRRERLLFGGEIKTEPPRPLTDAERTHLWVRSLNDQAQLENIIKQFSGTPLEALAASRLAELKKLLASSASPQPARPTTLLSPSNADFRICNNTSGRIGIALGYQESAGWKTEGWWNISASSCEILVRGKLSTRLWYVYAIDYDKGGQWGGDKYLCTRDKEFTILGRENCLARGFDRTGFFEVDIGSSTGWTVQMESEPSRR